MKKYPLIGICIGVVVLFVLGSLTNVVGNQSVNTPSVSVSPLFTQRTDTAINQRSREHPVTKFLGKDSASQVQTSMTVYPVLGGTVGQNNWYVSHVTVTFVVNDSIDGLFYALDEDAWTEYTIPFQVGAEGEHVLHWYWTDEHGTASEIYWISIKIDTIVPVINITVTPINRLRTLWWINASVFETTSGVDHVEFYINNTLLWTDFHPPYMLFWRGRMLGHKVKLISYDKAGNSEQLTASMMSLKPRWCQNQAQQVNQLHIKKIENMQISEFHGSVSGHITDSEMNPIENVRVRVHFHGSYHEGYSDSTGHYSVPGVPLCACLKNVTCDKIGYYSCYVLLSNNESTTHDFVLQPMQVYPTLSGFEGYNGWYIGDVSITLIGNDWGNHSYYALDDGSWTQYTTPILIGTDGLHVLHWFWIDGEGNISDVYSVGFKIDKIAPTITLTSTVQNIFKTIWLLEATVSDLTSGVVKVEFYVNDGYIGEATSVPWEHIYKGTGTVPQAIVYDAAGNSQISDPVTVLIKHQHNNQHINQFL